MWGKVMGVRKNFVSLQWKSILTIERNRIMALEIAAVPVLTGEAADRFDKLMEKSEERRGSIDFSREIAEARAILSKANF